MANLLKDQEGVAAIQDDIIVLADLLQNTMQDFSKCSQPLKSLDWSWTRKSVKSESLRYAILEMWLANSDKVKAI